MKSRLYYEVREILKRNHYKVSNNIAEQYIDSVVDYIKMQSNDYTVQQWFDDTRANYPNDLTILLEREVPIDA